MILSFITFLIAVLVMCVLHEWHTDRLNIITNSYLKAMGKIARQDHELRKAYGHINYLSNELYDIKYEEIGPILGVIESNMSVTTDNIRYDTIESMDYLVSVRTPLCRVHSSRKEKLLYMDRVYEECACRLGKIISEKLMEIVFTKKE